MRSIIRSKGVFTFFLFGFLTTFITAQGIPSELTDEEMIQQTNAFHTQKLAEHTAQYTDPCDVDWDFKFEVIRFERFSQVRIKSSLVGLPIDIRAENGKTVLKETMNADPLLIKLAGNENYSIYAADKCGNKVLAATFSTKQRQANDPLVVDMEAYKRILAWQKTDDNFAAFIYADQSLDEYAKVSLVQELLYQGQPLPDRLSNLNYLPSKDDFLLNKSFMDDCQCNAVTVAANYTLDPIQRIRSDGRISGEYGSNQDQRFRSNDIRADQYWAFEGPSRYQEMFVKTLRCVNAPYEFYWDDQSVSESESETLPVDFTATVEFNWICLDDLGRRSDCGCDRDLFFEWDYESVVSARAEILNGGLFCGSNRTAYAAATDAMTVAYSETDDASTYQTLAYQANGRVSECSQTYNGPTAGEFLEFAYNVYLLTQGPPEGGSGNQTAAQIQSTWQNNLVNEVIGQIDEALSEPWLNKTACNIDLGGRRRSLQQTGQSRNFSTTLRPNKPVRVVLSSAGSLQARGLRKWTTNASIYSSFRLAGIMQGGGSPGNDCCSPYLGLWHLSTIAEDVPGGATENSYQTATRAFFNIRGLFTNVWTETGDRFSYNGFSCPTPVNVLVVSPLSGDFDAFFDVSMVGPQVELSLDPSITLEGAATVRLVNVAGQVLDQQAIAQQQTLSFTTNRYPAGIYFIHAILPNGHKVTKKIALI